MKNDILSSILDLDLTVLIDLMVPPTNNICSDQIQFDL